MSAGGYIDALKELGVTELVGEDLGYYQGDYVMLAKPKKYEFYGSAMEYLFIVIGYGSCSGCDAWEGADSPLQRAELMVDILKYAKSFATLEEAKGYIVGKDGKEWYSHENSWPKFVNAVMVYEVPRDE